MRKISLPTGIATSFAREEGQKVAFAKAEMVAVRTAQIAVWVVEDVQLSLEQPHDPPDLVGSHVLHVTAKLA